MQLLFDMFSTLMSLELKLKVKTVNILMYGYNAGPIPITQYGSTVYIGMAMGGSAL